jgi:hypothetical protein
LLAVSVMRVPRAAVPIQLPSTRRVISPVPVLVVLPTVDETGVPMRTRRSFGSVVGATDVPA